MIFVCFVVFTFLFVAFFGGGKLSLDFHDLFYKFKFRKGEIASKGSLRRLFNFKLLLL